VGLGDELDSLCFATAERVRGLPEVQIPEAELVEELERLTNRFHRREHFDRFGDFQLEQLACIEALPAHCEGLWREAHPVAGLARNVDVGEKRHLHVNRALALALRAPALIDVEREAACGVAARTRFGRPR